VPDVRRAAVAALVAAPFVVGAVTTSSAAPAAPVAFTFTDARIAESSGLAVVDGLVVTTNDSGDAARVFTVDPATGDTVGVTTWADDAVDVEALAPAGDGEVWVADVGDNAHRRGSVRVARVPVGEGERSVRAPSYELVLPDGPRDAEALLVHPTTGRLHLVTKGVLGGEVLEAPRRLDPDRPNALREVGTAPGLVTDGAFLPDGRHVVVRSYGQGYVLAWPTWEVVERWDLPRQRQAEGLAVRTGPDGTDELLLSSEGVRTDVLREPVPAVVAARRATVTVWEALRGAWWPHLG